MLPGRFTSGAAKATVVGGKTPTQGVMALSDAINLLPGMGAHVLPALLLFCSPSCWSAGMSCGELWCGRQRAQARALPHAGEAVVLQKDISSAPCLPAFLCEQFPGKLNLTPLC